MPVAPAPSAGRGEVTLQPSYFTSSLYVDPLRNDIQLLIQAFAEQYVHSQTSQPFLLFKKVWSMQGWTWIHFKVFDARARESFLKVTARLFVERLDQKESLLARVVALFGLYVFITTQISSSAPPLHTISHVPIPIDQYTTLIDLPSALATNYLLSLQPHTTYILSNLLSAQTFHIVPESSHHPLDPRELPRERFVQDVQDGYHNAEYNMAGNRRDRDSSTDVPKKKGRPTKRDKAKKAKDALEVLDKWLDKNGYTPQPLVPLSSSGTSAANIPCHTPITTHVLLSDPPTTSRTDYRTQKLNFLESLEPSSQTLHRANLAVLARMRKIDDMAAEKGLEVGGEGGERTGLARVEKAVTGLENGGTGILGLLEGAGMEDELHYVDSAQTVPQAGSALDTAPVCPMEIDTPTGLPP